MLLGDLKFILCKVYTAIIIFEKVVSLDIINDYSEL